MEPTQAHFRRLEAMYRQAKANVYWRPTLTVREGEAEVSLEVRSDFHHPGNAAHGATCFKVLDDATFFAANSLSEHFLLTVSFNLHLLRPIADGVLHTIGRVVHRSRRLYVAEGVAYDSNGHEIARGGGTFMPSAIDIAAINIAQTA